MGRDLSKKRTVVIEYHLGFERMIRKAMENFQKMGLAPIFYRAAVQSINRKAAGKRGYYGASPNKQYEYDHRYDSALYMGSAIRERKLAVSRAAYEEFKELAGGCAGPALVETFGEEGFSPVNKKTAFSLNAHQEEVTSAWQTSCARSPTGICRGMRPALPLLHFQCRRSGRISRTFSGRPL